jgi:hypothetical protein
MQKRPALPTLLPVSRNVTESVYFYRAADSVRYALFDPIPLRLLPA